MHTYIYSHTHTFIQYTFIHDIHTFMKHEASNIKTTHISPDSFVYTHSATGQPQKMHNQLHVQQILHLDLRT
jgi:hypothetical protein